MATNRRTVLKTDMEFYKTPSWGTRALLYYEKFQGFIAEPCCGDGAISKVLVEEGYEVRASDIADRGYGKVQDYLSFRGINHNVITNPPYDKYIFPIISHALETTTNKICMLVRLAYLEGQDRYWELYKDDPPSRIWVFSERLSMYKGDSDKTDGGTTAYCWMVWSRHKPYNCTETRWIRPGFKAGDVKRFKWGKPHELLL